MSQTSKYGASTVLTKEVHPAMSRETDEWDDDCHRILEILDDASHPLRMQEIALECLFLSKSQVSRRIEDCIKYNLVRVREDGPDGRVTYYEPSHSVYACTDHFWLPKPIELE